MGVHGLWDLLSPVGRRVSVETLAGKRLAIDASIWLVQFMKAMRDEKGEMVKNAHLLGFFRRICKLLYLRTKPVFVFDGGTPALKRRTVIARRRQRENAQAKIRKTAEKLLLNQLKQIRLKELADELENQRSNVSKGKNIVTEEADVVDKIPTGTKLFADGCNQEALDEMLAASLAAEEDEGFTAAESSSTLPVQDEDEDEEMILPAIEGKIDPAILASLPPSMQLDLLAQMRERLMAENRQKYQRVKKVPARFSELQIQAYLKTVAFRREIDEVQKSAAGRGIGGVQTSRIASEANREFIFSSNYSGDKLVLTSTGEGVNNNDQNRVPKVDPPGSSVNNVASSEKCSTVAGFSVDEPQKDLENDVETYLDERGRVRVSRVRAMGIRMTRDIQRNLDLMKEIEQERVSKTENLVNQFTGNGAIQGNSAGEIDFSHASDEDPGSMTFENVKNEKSVLGVGTSMEISFVDNGQREFGNEDDDLFTQLVAGDPVIDFSVDSSLSKKQSLDSGSEPEWEEGGIENEGGDLSNDIEPEGKGLQVDVMNAEQEWEWEEGSLEIQEEASFFPAEYKKVVSKGVIEEEADLQEAIRRSLQDRRDWTSVDEPVDREKSRTTVEVVNCSADAEFTHKGDWRGGKAPSRFSSIQHDNTLNESQENTNDTDSLVKGKLAETNDRLEALVNAQLGSTCSKTEVLTTKECQGHPGLQDVNQHADENDSMEQEVCELGTSVKENSTCQVQPSDGHSKWVTETEKGSMESVDIAQESAKVEVRECFSSKVEDSLDELSSSDYRKEDVEATRASLEEEMLILGEEYKELGDKQRKLERNAESVNSEMFAECQELLQIFGLPYIIAPMEAEAQCAYMELVNLVDGVVTDDSDTFLFGARNVYKNIFDDRKYVETYFMKDIESELGLNREKLIRMALLLGSDYTEGVSGIGIVNAIEVVNAFPEEDGLRKFREWIESPDPSILGSKAIKVSASDGRVSGSKDEAQMEKQNFMDKHRNVSKNWHMPSSFPSEDVISAYNSPQVDKSTDPFSWGKPDHYVLRKLCWEKFGWSIQKADELLLPVLREYNKRETQLRLEAFYTFNEKFAKIRSKRIKKAVKGITGNMSSDLMDESLQDVSRKKRNRRENQERASEGKEHTDVSNEGMVTEKSNGKKLRKTNAPGEAQLGGEDQNGLPTVTEGEICQSGSSKGSTVKGRSRGGCVGARKRNSISTKRTRRKGNPSSEHAVSWSDDEIYYEGEQGPPVGSREPSEVRRSGRPGKEVKYRMSEVELENGGEEEAASDAPKAGYAATVASTIPGEGIGREESLCLDEANRACGSGEDYLTMGGGFWLDEPSWSDLGEDENTGGISCSGEEEEEVEVEGMEKPEALGWEQEEIEDEGIPRKEECLRNLRAMPNLKRKKWKN